MTVLRWGVLSPARIAVRKVIPAIQRAERCEVVALASRDGERARAAAGALGVPRAHGSYEALLADPDVDAVYLPLPNHLHAPWTVEAARAGKHVLCEKPLGTSAEEAQRMVDACRAEGVALMEAFMYRLHPSWVAVRELVRSGRIGRLQAVQSWFSFYNDDPDNIRNVAAYGGGAMLDIGCYLVNLSRMLFESEPDAVHASVVRDPVSGVDVTSGAVLSFGLRVATLTCSIRAEPDQRVYAYGTEGHVSVGIPFNIPADRPTEVTVTAGGEPPVRPAREVLRFEPADMYALQAEAFARAVLDGEPLPVPPQDAVANLRVIDRILGAVAPAGRAPVA